MIKISENFNRKEMVDRWEGYERHKGNISYGYSNEELEEQRQNKIKQLKELTNCLENMTIEEFDAYFYATSQIFESDLCDAQDLGALYSSSQAIGYIYGQSSSIPILTTMSHYETEEDEDEDC